MAKVRTDPDGVPILNEPHTLDELADAGLDTTAMFDIDSIKATNHDIGQEGAYIVCRTSGHKHGYYIGPNKELYRKDDGSLDIRVVA